MYGRKYIKNKVVPTYNSNLLKLVKQTQSTQSSINSIKRQRYISVEPNGRLGNQLFQIISCWAYAKKNNMNFILTNSYNKNYNYYYTNFFSKLEVKNNINFIQKTYGIFENINRSVDLTNNNILVRGFLQNANNFNLYRKEILELFFNVKEETEFNNKFFIHIRFGDFLRSPPHNINLDTYYRKAIDHMATVLDMPNSTFYIVSDNISIAKTKSYITHLSSLTSNVIFIENYSEIDTFELFKNCSGAIIGNSTFGWWGAYIINCPNRVIVCPNKFLKGNYNFSGLYMNYKIINI